MGLMYPHDDAQSLFDYPEDRLYKPAAAIRDPNNQDLEGDPVRFVIKRGHTTFTSLGRLTGFESYPSAGVASLAPSTQLVAVHAYDNDSGSFSRGGDSGSLIVGPQAQVYCPSYLTGGTGLSGSADITFGNAHGVALE